MTQRLWLPVTLMLLFACGGSQTRGTRDRTVITEREIEESALLDAFEVVRALRPEFLRTRGSSSFRATEPVEAQVYVDGVRIGDTASLRRLPREVLREIRYVDAREATTRYGTGHGAGAILVATKR